MRGVLSTQFMLAGGILLLVSMAVTTFVSLYAEVRTMEERRIETVEQTEAKWLPLLSRAVWILSDEDVELITLAIAEQDAVEALTLEIYGDATTTLGVQPPHHAIDVVWPIRHWRGDELLEIGRLTLTTHEATMREIAARLLPDLIPVDLLKGLIVLVPFFILVHVGITRQLNRLSVAVGDLAVGEAGAGEVGAETPRIELRRRKIFAREDEFDELVHTFNALLADIREERRIRTDRERALERALKRSEFLLREVHHRVKNNLQMLISMFSLHAERLSEPERSVMVDAELRIRSLALVHIQLYQDENITSVEVVSYTGALLNSLTAAARGHDGISRVRLSVRGEPVDVPLDKAIPLALVLNELGTNAIKHAFAAGEAGEIAVDVEHDDDTLRVAISDDGRGVGPDFSIGGSANFGLTIVATLLEQIDARLRCERPEGGGTRFVVTVPL